MENNSKKFLLTLRYADKSSEVDFYHIIKALDKVEAIEIAEKEIGEVYVIIDIKAVSN